MANEQEKEAAGRAAAKLVRDGDVVGLGTGSTAYFAVVALGEKVRAGLKIVGIPTSIATEDLARKAGIPLTTLEEHPEIDITIDGADEIDPHLNLIKGGGGALLREKIVASVTKKMVVVSDSTKVVKTLGRFPLPVEIVPFARAVVERKLSSLGATSKLRLKPDGQPYITDSGNHILDAGFGRISDPRTVAHTLSETPGVVEHGLFIGFAKVALVGIGNSVEEFRPDRRRSKPKHPAKRNRKNSRPKQ
jgi:ribose 5-phosphate isomerase A